MREGTVLGKITCCLIGICSLSANKCSSGSKRLSLYTTPRKHMDNFLIENEEASCNPLSLSWEKIRAHGGRLESLYTKQAQLAILSFSGYSPKLRHQGLSEILILFYLPQQTVLPNRPPQCDSTSLSPARLSLTFHHSFPKVNILTFCIYQDIHFALPLLKQLCYFPANFDNVNSVTLIYILNDCFKFRQKRSNTLFFIQKSI